MNGAWDPTVDGYGQIQFMPDSLRRLFLFRTDTLRRTVALIAVNDTTKQTIWAYSEPDAGHLVLDGVEDSVRGDSLHITLRKRDLANLPLMRRRPWFK